MRPRTIAEALRSACLDPVDARVLLQHVLDVGHAYVVAHGGRTLSEAESRRFRALVDRRRAGEPVAYLVGWREFYGRRFRVAPEVLIPRPETELLVDLALGRMPAGQCVNLLDLGTGSGCVALTLALERPSARVIAVDASAAALAVARDNADVLGARNVELRLGDWFEPVAGERFDLILANPPYVAAEDPHLAQGDLRFEPRGALDGGADGLACIRRIVQGALPHLVPGGWLLFEHGHDQAEASGALLRAAGFVDICDAYDLAGHPRASGGRRAPAACASSGAAGLK